MRLSRSWLPSWSELDAGAGGRKRVSRDLFLVSLLVLFLELLLIRWIGSEVRIVAYFKNMVIVACFLGLGLGCAMRRLRLGPGWSLLTLLLLVVLVKPPFEAGEAVTRMFSDALTTVHDSPIWRSPMPAFMVARQSVPRMLSQGVSVLYVVVLFSLIIFIFVALGQALGRLMSLLEDPIKAYSANILASLLGIWAFAGMSWAGFPPWTWFLGAVALILWFLRGRPAPLVAGLALGLGILAAVSISNVKDGGAEYWSPYHKLNLWTAGSHLSDGREIRTGHLLAVNETYFQRTVNRSPEFVNKYPFLLGGAEAGYDEYSLPYRFMTRTQDVLIVGAGMGNDVAAALRNGAERVDAVEIDPVIQSLGRRHHMERPYDSPRVRTVIDDARAFFRKTDRKYDLIVFGLLDSHTLSSEFSTVRLDHYVYTRESLEEAKKLLKPGGAVALSFFIERRWIAQRIEGLMTSVFGESPLVLNIPRINTGAPHEHGETLFLGGNGRALLQALETDQKLAQVVMKGAIQFSGSVPLTTDDWPYLYLERRTVPSLNLLFLAVVLALSATFYRGTVGHLSRVRWDFFFLGAGFMLIEVQAISKLALLYGTTWIVNVVVISAVLFMILMANLYVSRVGKASLLPYVVGVLLILLAAYFFPTGWFLRFDGLVRSLLAGGLFSLPVLFAGIIFAVLFRQMKGDPERVRVAFGSNLLGAVVGGMAEVLSFVWGMNLLLLVAMGFYLLAWISGRRSFLVRELQGRPQESQ
jgi:spermidine synthase